MKVSRAWKKDVERKIMKLCVLHNRDTGKLSRKEKKRRKKEQAHLFTFKNGKVRPAYAFHRWAFDLTQPRHVADDTINGIRVSTVFLGTNHNYRGSGHPILFETVVFLPNGRNLMYRYATAKQAAKGHREMVAQVREKL